MMVFAVTAPFVASELADHKKALAVIAVAENPSEFEKLAATELKCFLEKMTGAEFKIAPEASVDSGHAAIYLGRTNYASSNKVDFTKTDKEEWILKTVGSNLIISGGRPVGTLYGVYEFLEKLGVYFLADDQTVIPSTSVLALPELNERNKPAFSGRNIYDLFSVPAYKAKVPEKVQRDYWLHRLRSRLNGGHGVASKEMMDALYLGDIFNLSMSFHTFSYYVDPDKYFNTHPEYFSMSPEGKRQKPKTFFAQGSLCLTNKDVWAVTLDSLRGYIKRDRTALPKEKWPVIYDISTLDNTPYICHCPKCSEVTKVEGGDSGLVLRYINYVATEIAKEYPEITIRTFAYSSTKNVPQITRPVSNVLIQYCDEFPVSDCYRPLTSSFNTEMLANLKRWHDAGTKLALWDYWNMGGTYYNPPRIETVTDAIQPDIKTFRELGIVSLFLEAEKDPAKTQNFIDLNYFLASQFMVNPDQDQEKLIGIFMDNYYGPAAPEMKRYLQILRDGVKNHPTIQRTMRVARWNFITPKFMLDSYKMFRRAEAKTPAGSLYEKRVHHEMIPLLWQILLARTENTENFNGIGIRMEQIENECRKYCIEYVNRDNPAEPGKYLKQFEEQFTALTAKLPIPERFRQYAVSDIRVYGYPCFRPVPEVMGNIVNDPDSPTGKALMSSNPDPSYHGAKTIVHGKNWEFPATRFEVACLDVENSKGVGLTIDAITADEKYHWYKIPKAEISSKCLFWGHCWALQFELSQAYQLADGIADNNVWDVWFSAKFTGPAWVKDSKRENAVYLDMVTLVRPGASPQGGGK